MRIVKDADGGNWPIELNVYELKRTRPTFGDLLNPEYFLGKIDDAIFLVDLIFVLTDKTAAERGIDEATFEKKFRGDALAAAKKELLEEYVDFFPSNVRATMRTALEKIEAFQEKARADAAKNLNDAEKELERQLAIAAKNSESESTNSPESSESIPTDGRCGV